MNKRSKNKKRRKKGRPFSYYAPSLWFYKDNLIPHDSIITPSQVDEWRYEVEQRYQDLYLGVKFCSLVDENLKSIANSEQMTFWLKLNKDKSELYKLIEEYYEIIFEEIPFLMYLDIYRYDSTAEMLPWSDVRCFSSSPVPVTFTDIDDSGNMYEWEDEYTEEDNPILEMFREYPEFNIADALSTFISTYSLEEEDEEIEE
ncbi:hypothetical protein [Moorena producens]|uniref:hypothetical protein n=1 Tax=Moorena producens TaxID=1155739 RepID=UPI003C76E014